MTAMDGSIEQQGSGSADAAFPDRFECKEHSRLFESGEALEQHNKAKHPAPQTTGQRLAQPLGALSGRIRSSRLARYAVVLGLVAVLAYGGYAALGLGAGSGSGKISSLAPVIDNVSCSSLEGSVMHIHPHLSIVVNNKSAAVPAQIGILGNRCLYWIHTHDDSGTIHVESPILKNFTLGQFLDIWNATQGYAPGFSPSLLANATSVVAYVNGNVYNGYYRNIDLLDGEQIRLVVTD